MTLKARGLTGWRNMAFGFKWDADTIVGMTFMLTWHW